MMESDAVVEYASLQTPIGRLFVAASERGVCDVSFGDTREETYRRHLLQWAAEVVHDPGALALVFEELDHYFSGRLQRFSVPVDLRNISEFTDRVLCETHRIPFGELRSYRDIACRIGSPTASRAVGGALGRNPVPVIVPCHRVISHQGRLGGLTGGVATKRALLRVEGHAVVDRQPAARVGARVTGRPPGVVPAQSVATTPWIVRTG